MAMFCVDKNKCFDEFKIEQNENILKFEQIYVNYLVQLSPLCFDCSEGISWAPIHLANQFIFNTAYCAVLSHINQTEFPNGKCYCKSLNFKEPSLITLNNSDTNILIFPIYMYERRVEQKTFKQYICNSIINFSSDKAVDLIIFIPLTCKNNANIFFDLSTEDFLNGNADDLKLELFMRMNRFDMSFLEYANPKKTVDIMTIGDYIKKHTIIDIVEMKAIFEKVLDAQKKLEKNNLGRLFVHHKSMFFELFKIFSNHTCNTNYLINERNLKAKILDNDISVEEDIPFNIENIGKFDSVSLIANNNIDLIENSKILNLIMTSNYLALEYGGIEYLDNTFIVAGYFKSVELLLYNVLSKFYKNIIDEKTNHKFVKNNLDIGKMNEIVAVLTINGVIDKNKGSSLFDKIESWRNDRNNYFHKQLLKKDDYNKLVNSTLELLYYIIGILPKKIIDKHQVMKPNDLFEETLKKRKINTKYLKK